MSSLKILEISTGLWSMGEKKGTPSVYYLQKGLINAGHEVHLVIPAKENHKVQTLDNIDFHYFKAPFTSFHPKNILLRRLLAKINWLFFILYGWLKARALANKIKPDVVYGHTSYGAPIAYLVAKKLRIPNITRLYGTFLYPHLSSFWQRLKKIEEVIAFKIPSNLLIITDDGTKGNEVAKYLKVPAKRMRFWMNGVDKNIFDSDFDITAFKRQLNIDPNVKIILSASRLAHWKRVDRLVKAIPEITKERNDVVFLVAGDGPEKETLVEVARALAVSSFVRFLGAIPSIEVVKFMNAADIFISLQDYTNIGNPLLEAMTCGRCILALDTGDTARIIQSGKTGVLLNSGQLEELPKQILHLLEDNNLRKELGKNARQYALNNFLSWDERIKMEVAEIEKLCSNYKQNEQQ